LKQEVELSEEFVHAFISRQLSDFHSPEVKEKDKQRHVRIVSVFIQSLVGSKEVVLN